MKKIIFRKMICLLLCLTFTAAMLAGCGASGKKAADAGSSGGKTKTDLPDHTSGDGTDSSADRLDLSPYAISNAVYPQMASYPSEDLFYITDGSFDSAGYSSAYQAWRDARDAQSRQPEGYRDGPASFFESSLPIFLKDAEAVNPVYSPLNIYMALAMLAETTDTESRAQILTALGAPNIPKLRAQADAVWNANYCKDGAVTSVLASSVWLNEDIAFKKDTLDLLADNYYTSSFRGKMGSDDYNKALQGWLSEQTGGLLKESAGEVEMDPKTVMTLAATVYYQGKWAHTFSESATSNEIFHSPYGDMSCDFMHQSGTRSYYWGERFSAVAQSMEAQGGNMWLILPDEDTAAADLLSDDQLLSLLLSECGLRASAAQSKYLIVNLSVPKFDVCCQIDLEDGLKKLGITDVFDGRRADFSPLTDDTDLFLSKAQHAARVVIDEEGCTAAAFTVMMTAGAAMPPDEKVDFVLDRPFLFVLTGMDGLPLFAGIVNQP